MDPAADELLPATAAELVDAGVLALLAALLAAAEDELLPTANLAPPKLSEEVAPVYKGGPGIWYLVDLPGLDGSSG